MQSQSASLLFTNKNPVHIIPDKFVSVALDASQIFGGFWWDRADSVKNGLGNSRVPPLDLEQEKLVFLTELLSPRCIRIGGTEADRVFYSMKKKKKELPEGYHYTLSRKRWEEIGIFCRKTGSTLMLTINAGPGPRQEKQRWRRKNARHLIRYSEDKNQSISVWELGNEVNAYSFFLGFNNRLSPGEYACDIKRLKNSVNSKSSTQIAGPALAVWPLLGETLPFLKKFLSALEPGFLDIITWHYYPQQSFRTPLAIRRAKKSTLLKYSRLEEGARQARKLKTLRDKYSPGTPIWLGETGHALCGGEPGLSDTFYSGFWWLDNLGMMAREGIGQVVRQTLTGGDYGLLDKETHTPLPDYWTTLFWNRYAGNKVYTIENKSMIKGLRCYLHSLKGFEKENKYCLIYINLERETIGIQLPDELPPIQHQIILNSDDIYSRNIFHNGALLAEEMLPHLPDSLTIEPTHECSVPQLSYGFFLLGETPFYSLEE